MARQRGTNATPPRRLRGRRRFLTPIALGLGPLLATGCQAWNPADPSPSRQLSDGRTSWTLTRLRDVTPRQQIGWLDARTILFIGWSRSQGEGLYAWDQKGPARLILADAYRFCHDGRTWTVKVGRQQPGSETMAYSRHRLNPSDLTTTPLGPLLSPPGGGSDNPFTCTEEPIPEALRGRIWRALRPGDGYLDLGSDMEKRPQASLLQADGRSRIKLDIPIENQLTTRATYSAYTKSYTIFDVSFPDSVLQAWGKRGSLDIWSLRPDGRLRTVKVPAGPWAEMSSGDRLIEPARDGIAISSSGGSRSPDTTAGLYRVRPDRTFTKFDTGIIGNLTASPDGCRLAYKLSLQDRDGELRSVDLCPRSP